MAKMRDLGMAAKERQRQIMLFIDDQNGEATVWEVCKHFPKELDNESHNALYRASLMDLEAVEYIALVDAVYRLTEEGNALVKLIKSK